MKKTYKLVYWVATNGIRMVTIEQYDKEGKKSMSWEFTAKEFMEVAYFVKDIEKVNTSRE